MGPQDQPLDRPLERHGAARTAVVWDALRERLGESSGLRVLDVGGGTGVLAVRLAALGHQVTLVDPSPDALAAASRRAHEGQVADRVTGVQGDLTDLPGLAEISGLFDAGSVDLVLCHEVLGIVEDRSTALATLAAMLRPGGTLSLLVAQRHAAVVARAMAGHVHSALELLETDPPGEYRFTADEVTTLLHETGLDLAGLHAVRVFTDLVPSALLDLEPGAMEALVELERAVARRPEYFALAGQLHALAIR